MDGTRGVHRVLVGKPEGKRPLGRPRRRWEDNVRRDLWEIGVEGYRHFFGIVYKCPCSRNKVPQLYVKYIQHVAYVLIAINNNHIHLIFVLYNYVTEIFEIVI
jgi:hypothetical protein